MRHRCTVAAEFAVVRCTPAQLLGRAMVIELEGAQSVNKLPAVRDGRFPLEETPIAKPVHARSIEINIQMTPISQSLDIDLAIEVQHSIAKIPSVPDWPAATQSACGTRFETSASCSL